MKIYMSSSLTRHSTALQFQQNVKVKAEGIHPSIHIPTSHPVQNPPMLQHFTHINPLEIP